MFFCSKCEKKYRRFRYICDCGGVLLVHYKKYKWRLDKKANGIWKYRFLLPRTRKRITLDEGNTSLIKSTMHKKYKKLYFKFEGENPTGSFKDRGSSLVISHAKSKLYKTVGVASTGNMGASISAYAAHAGLKARVFVPDDTPAVKISQMIAHGADLVRVHGTFGDCVKRLWEDVEKKKIYLAMSGPNPYYLEGEKTISFEIFEEIKIPDKVIVPMGSGGVLTAIYKGFWELKQARKIKKLPQMIGIQGKDCSPIVDAWKKGTEKVKPVKKAKGIASAILVKTPFNGRTAIRAINQSGGSGEVVTDTQIKKAIKELGKEGIFAEPAAAAPLAALQKIKTKKNEKIVLMITGHGLKEPEVVVR